MSTNGSNFIGISQFAASGTALRNNYTATTDPGVNDDSTQGYSVGSEYLNTLTQKFWKCRSNATGAASWVMMGVGLVAISVASVFLDPTPVVVGAWTTPSIFVVAPNTILGGP